MIGIGNDFGGPEHRGSQVAKVLNRAMNIAANERRPNYDDGTEAWVNPIFIIPGSVSKPDFEGIKRGHFSRKRKGLVLMIAVPEHVTNEQSAREFLVAALRESVRSASQHFTSKGMSFSVLGAEKIIRAIERELRRTSVCFPPIPAARRLVAAFDPMRTYIWEPLRADLVLLASPLALILTKPHY